MLSQALGTAEEFHTLLAQRAVVLQGGGVDLALGHVAPWSDRCKAVLEPSDRRVQHKGHGSHAYENPSSATLCWCLLQLPQVHSPTNGALAVSATLCAPTL